MRTEVKQEIIAKYKLHEKDTGSPEVQIAILTERINHLNEHLKPVSYTHLDVYKRQTSINPFATRARLAIRP